MTLPTIIKFEWLSVDYIDGMKSEENQVMDLWYLIYCTDKITFNNIL